MTDARKNEWNNAVAWLPAKVSAMKTALKVFYNASEKGTRAEFDAALMDLLDACKELDSLLNFLTDAAKAEPEPLTPRWPTNEEDHQEEGVRHPGVPLRLQVEEPGRALRVPAETRRRVLHGRVLHRREQGKMAGFDLSVPGREMRSRRLHLLLRHRPVPPLHPASVGRIGSGQRIIRQRVRGGVE